MEQADVRRLRRIRRHKCRIAVRLRLQDGECGKIAVRARLVLDHDGGVGRCTNAFGQMPRHAVGGAAGREWHDQRDALRRIGFRRRRREATRPEEAERRRYPRVKLALKLISSLFFGYWAASPSRIGLDEWPDNGLARYRTHTYYMCETNARGSVGRSAASLSRTAPSQQEPLAMKNNRNRQVILKSRPADIPQADNFEIIESDVPDLRDGQILVHNSIFRSNPPCAAGSAMSPIIRSRCASAK